MTMILNGGVKYAIQVTGCRPAPDTCSVALEFTRAALRKGHPVIRVFFQGEGVWHGLKSTRDSGGLSAVSLGWAVLARDFQVDLVVCVSAAERRGLDLNREHHEYESAGLMLVDGFRIGGLGQWMDACMRCDRFVRFTR